PPCACITRFLPYCSQWAPIPTSAGEEKLLGPSAPGSVGRPGKPPPCAPVPSLESPPSRGTARADPAVYNEGPMQSDLDAYGHSDALRPHFFATLRYCAL